VAVRGWLVDKSAAMRSSDPEVAEQLEALSGSLFLCRVGELEQLYSARSAEHYERVKAVLEGSFEVVGAPADVLDRALALQGDLARHHGMWHRTPIPDLLIAETALHHGLGVVHVDQDFGRIAEVRPLTVRRLA
jgi:predicted nucleic acid-binding protein